jgi:hypothetical protein
VPVFARGDVDNEAGCHKELQTKTSDRRSSGALERFILQEAQEVQKVVA